MSVRETIKGQIIGALSAAKFPIESPGALFAALPMGAETTCQAGDFKVTAVRGRPAIKPRRLPL